MERIIGHRQSGKTETAINIALTENIPILVKDINSKRSLALRQSGRNLGWNPQPLSLYNLIENNKRGTHDIPETVIVDDAEYVLQALLHEYGINNVRAMTFTDIDLPPAKVPVMDFTVWDFVNTTENENIIIYDDSLKIEVFNNRKDEDKSINKIPYDYRSRKIKKIESRDMIALIIHV